MSQRHRGLTARHPSMPLTPSSAAAGIAGLLAARVLADHSTGDARRARRGDARKGVPQGRMLHVLLPRALEIVERLFPGYGQELEAAGVAEPVTPIRGYRGTANRLWRYKGMRRWPERFVVLGGAVCGLNPIYGQGHAHLRDRGVARGPPRRRDPSPRRRRGHRSDPRRHPGADRTVHGGPGPRPGGAPGRDVGRGTAAAPQRIAQGDLHRRWRGAGHRRCESNQFSVRVQASAAASGSVSNREPEKCTRSVATSAEAAASRSFSISSSGTSPSPP